jgi:hypothetical protein
MKLVFDDLALADLDSIFHFDCEGQPSVAKPAFLFCV